MQWLGSSSCKIFHCIIGPEHIRPFLYSLQEIYLIPFPRGQILLPQKASNLSQTVVQLHIDTLS